MHLDRSQNNHSSLFQKKSHGLNSNQKSKIFRDKRNSIQTEISRLISPEGIQEGQYQTALNPLAIKMLKEQKTEKTKDMETKQNKRGFWSLLGCGSSR